ncbi:MAG TPA: hypothetical protein VFH63_00850 [candidate division Zixibacteria bacterium]|nr:hypothetical protein [candidate division Zixibacteria bacterium]
MTPKPGQIRCPTCHRSTPPAAYCTQCGTPIPASAQIRPRGLDREELEARIRGRRPSDAFRRGSLADEGGGGYLPFTPEPEDRLAVRDPDEQPTRRVDRLANQPAPPVQEPPPAHEAPAEHPAEPAWPQEPQLGAGSRPHAQPQYTEPQYTEPQYEEPYAYDDQPYGAPEDAYAYPYAEERRGGSSALPIIGFAALCVLALAVGAVLAGIFTGDDGVGLATPTPSVEATPEATPEPTPQATAPPPSASAGPATPEPEDGPVAFPDGAVYELHVCGSNGYTPDLDGCQVDGPTDDGRAWILVVFDNAAGSDRLDLSLRSGGSTLLEETRQLGEVVDCSPTCAHGLIYGLVLQGLDPSDYEVVVRRNGEFADRVSFTVGG